MICITQQLKFDYRLLFKPESLCLTRQNFRYPQNKCGPDGCISAEGYNSPNKCPG